MEPEGGRGELFRLARRAAPMSLFSLDWRGVTDVLGKGPGDGGADSRNRTVDPIITNDVLYQLS
jgi:hypothetical protein